MNPSIKLVIGSFLVVEVADCIEFPSKAVECLAEGLNEEKPVLIRWELIYSEEYLVVFKQRGQSAFPPLQKNSASLLGTEVDLITELSKQGIFQLPLLLNALNLSIGCKIIGGSLDLLNVSLNVKQEIDNWRLIDYAARDDSLSIRFLLLVDWDFALQNGDERKL
jgi:hypothetical protein